MKIEINNHRKIFAIQEEFNVVFPNLKLSFYEKPNTAGGPSSKNIIMSNSKTLAECRNMHETGFISILPGMTIGELKQNFRDVYGLTLDIVKNSGKINQDESESSEKTTLEELNQAVE
jgi:hypothetical protein